MFSKLLTEFVAAIANCPEAAQRNGHVRMVWEDGELTSQKAGPLLWQRGIHQLSPPKGSDFSHDFPNKSSNSNHSWTWVRNEIDGMVVRLMIGGFTDFYDDNNIQFPISCGNGGLPSFVKDLWKAIHDDDFDAAIDALIEWNWERATS